jgi:hypothetical protein
MFHLKKRNTFVLCTSPLIIVLHGGGAYVEHPTLLDAPGCVKISFYFLKKKRGLSYGQILFFDVLVLIIYFRERTKKMEGSILLFSFLFFSFVFEVKQSYLNMFAFQAFKRVKEGCPLIRSFE